MNTSGRRDELTSGTPRDPSKDPLIPLMGPSGGGGAVVAGLGTFDLVRTLAGQGHAHKPRVTLPRYAT
jgi:hypothetical protein